MLPRFVRLMAVSRAIGPRQRALHIGGIMEKLNWRTLNIKLRDGVILATQAELDLPLKRLVYDIMREPTVYIWNQLNWPIGEQLRPIGRWSSLNGN